MTVLTPSATKNLDNNHYGLDLLPWSRVEEHLASDMPKPETATFLGTVRPDGRPHSSGIGAAWSNGVLHFTSSPGAAKAKHLAANPNCTVSIRLKGVDVVLEGSASRVTDHDELEAVRAIYNAGGWPAELDADGDAFTAPFNAPSAGPPPYHVYRLTLRSAFAVAYEEPFGATRWDFEG